MRHTLQLNIAGLGIVLYSPWAVEHITRGEDFLAKSYTAAGDIAALVNEGSIVGICTGSPGTYSLTLYSGTMDEAAVAAAEFKVRLSIEVRDETLCIRDLYDFISWQPECSKSQTVSIPNGFYKLTAYTSLHERVGGDDQAIFVHFEAMQSTFRTVHAGVPLLC